MTTKHTPLPRVTVDSALDAASFCTLREHDGSEHGNTDTFIATVYDDQAAAYIAHAANAYPLAMEFVRAIARALRGERNRFGKFESLDIVDGEPLRALALRFDTDGARDRIEQAQQVAEALLRELGEDA